MVLKDNWQPHIPPTQLTLDNGKKHDPLTTQIALQFVPRPTQQNWDKFNPEALMRESEAERVYVKTVLDTLHGSPANQVEVHQIGMIDQQRKQLSKKNQRIRDIATLGRKGQLQMDPTERDIAKIAELPGTLLVGVGIQAAGLAIEYRKAAQLYNKPLFNAFADANEHLGGPVSTLKVGGESLHSIYIGEKTGKPVNGLSVIHVIAEHVAAHVSSKFSRLLRPNQQGYIARFPNLAITRAELIAASLADLIEANPHDIHNVAERAPAEQGWSSIFDSAITIKKAIDRSAGEIVNALALHDPEKGAEVATLLDAYTPDELHRIVMILTGNVEHNLKALYRSAVTAPADPRTDKMYASLKQAALKFAEGRTDKLGIFTERDVRKIYVPGSDANEKKATAAELAEASAQLTGLVTRAELREVPAEEINWRALATPTKYFLSRSTDEPSLSLHLEWRTPNGDVRHMFYRYNTENKEADWLPIHVPAESQMLREVFSSGFLAMRQIMDAHFQLIHSRRAAAEARMANRAPATPATPITTESTYSIRPLREKTPTSSASVQAPSEISQNAERRKFGNIPRHVLKKLPPDYAERAKQTLKDANDGLPCGIKTLPNHKGVTAVELRDRDIRIIATPRDSHYAVEYVVSREDMDNPRFVNNMWDQLLKKQTARAQEAAKQRKSKKNGA